MYNARMNNLLGEGKTAAKSGAVYSAAVCIYIVINLFASLIISGASISGDGAAYISYLCSPVAIILSLAVANRFLKIPASCLFPVKCRPKYFFIAILLAFGLLFALSPLNTLFVRLLTLMGYTPSESSIPSLDGGGIAGALIVIAVLPAFLEEALFRGAMLGCAGEDAGGVRAIFLTAFAFSLYHGSIEQTLYQFICGALFALLALRSGSVLPSVLVHFLNNAVILVLERFNLFDQNGFPAMPGWAMILVIVLAALSLAAALLWLIFGKRKLPRGNTQSVKSFFVWAAAGIAVMALIWILGLFSL